MEVVYSCDFPRKPRAAYCPAVPLACAWSCRNLVAFTSERRGPHGDIGEHTSYPIHIMDPEHPWDVCTVRSGHSDVITCLEWDQSGARLLSADAGGRVRCWATPEHLLNGWEAVGEGGPDGEPLLALAWLHNGIKLDLHVEKVGAMSFGEKFSRARFHPSLAAFGGRAGDGWVGVSASGLARVWLLRPGGALLSAVRPLSRPRARVAAADAAFTPAGHVVVATSDGSSSSPIHFYRLTLSVVSEKCRVETELLPSLFLRCSSDPSRRDKYPAVSHLRFVTRENSEQVVVCVSSAQGSVVECWSLRKEGLPLNKLFQQIPSLGDKQPSVQKWRILSTTSDLERVSSVALPRLPISLSSADMKLAGDTKFFPGLGLVLAFCDGSVHVLHRLTLQKLCAFSPMGGGGGGGAGGGGVGGVGGMSRGGPGVGGGVGGGSEEPPMKRGRGAGPHQAAHFSAVALSPSCCALLAVENSGKVSVSRVSPWLGHPLEAGAALRNLLFLLEYGLVTGHDAWDVLLHVQPGTAAPLADRLAEEYARQAQPLQQALQTRVLALRAWLYRLSPGTAVRSADLHTRLLLHAVSCTLKSLLRPTLLHTPDRGPGDRLAEICSKNTDTDIDKVMLNLKTEEFVLDTLLLQSLQQLIQWVADFTLYLLASLPNQGSISRPGVSFLRDGPALAMLRELLVVVRIWGLMNHACLPVFTATSDTQDSLSLLFKLLTKLWLCCRDEGHGLEPDDGLLDECCLLPSHLVLPSADWLPSPDGVSGRLPPGKPPSRVAFGRGIAYAGQPGPVPVHTHVLARSPGHQKLDNLRRVNLGVNPTEDIKVCTRCGCITMLRSLSKAQAAGPFKCWEQRWVRSCLCGGLWRRVPPFVP
ncbi:mediator of RNA polymerase II transcription subunit 16 [Lampetra planeri]